MNDLRLTDAGVTFTTDYHLATLSSFARDGSIHAVPVGFTLVDSLVRIIASGPNQKVLNLRRDPHATVAQFAGATWATFIGTARILEDAESVDLAVELYTARYRAPRPNPLRVVIAIDVTKTMSSPGLFER